MWWSSIVVRRYVLCAAVQRTRLVLRFSAVFISWTSISLCLLFVVAFEGQAQPRSKNHRNSDGSTGNSDGAVGKTESNCFCEHFSTVLFALCVGRMMLAVQPGVACTVLWDSLGAVVHVLFSAPCCFMCRTSASLGVLLFQHLSFQLRGVKKAPGHSTGSKLNTMEHACEDSMCCR